MFGEKELIHKFSADDDTRNALKVGGRLFVKFDSDGQDGCIVFTGQPGERKIGKKKTLVENILIIEKITNSPHMLHGGLDKLLQEQSQIKLKQ